MTTPNRPPLSHAAQAVLDAVPPFPIHEQAIAAVLRAVIKRIHVCSTGPIHYPNPYGEGLRDRERNIIGLLDCIAAELEGLQ